MCQFVFKLEDGYKIISIFVPIYMGKFGSVPIGISLKRFSGGESGTPGSVEIVSCSSSVCFAL